MRILLLATALLAPSLLVAQTTPRDLARERAESARWLATDPLSPARALAMAEIPATGLTVGGSDGEVAIPDHPRALVREVDGRIVLSGWGADRPLPRDHATALRGLHLEPIGMAGAISLMVYRDDTPGKRPVWYAYDPHAQQEVTLTASAPVKRHILAPNGTTVEGMEVGTVSATVAGQQVLLHVIRISAGEESQLLINFRDGTTGAGTYGAGRYVELLPRGGDRYTLDFNRAFNPYCAYSSVFPCPLPWAGNQYTARIEAGEKYPPEHLTR